MSLPDRDRSPGAGQGVPAPSSDAIDALVEAVSTGGRPPSASPDDGDRPARSLLTLPRGTRRSWFSSRLTRWIAPALVAFTIGLGGAVWSLRTLDSFAPQTDSVDVSPVPHTPVAPTTPPVAPPSPAPVDHLTSIELRPSAPFARVQHPRPARTARTEGQAVLALSEVEGSLGQAGEPLRTDNSRTALNEHAPVETLALIAVAAAPIDASAASPVPSAPEERPALAERAAAATSADAAEETAVRDTVEEYAQALEQLDVNATAVLWPSVDRRALSRAFASLKSQDVMVEDCDVALTETTATARCHGTAQYVVKVGPSSPRTGRYEWLFKMRKHDAAWKIEGLSASPMASGSRDQQ